MNSLCLGSVALTLAASLLIFTPPALSMDFPEAAKTIAEACPGLVKRDFPSATPQDTAAACGCMRDTIAASAKDYPSSLPTPQQWEALSHRAIKQCGDPLARRVTVQRCIADAAWRKALAKGLEINDAQFERYCHCHVNLSFDEAAKGGDFQSPEFRRALLAKSATQCLAALPAARPVN